MIIKFKQKGYREIECFKIEETDEYILLVIPEKKQTKKGKLLKTHCIYKLDKKELGDGYTILY